MPDDMAGRADGRLNLEQQKKRAKELLRGLHAGDGAATSRLRERHPRGPSLTPSKAQLADAQLVLAREVGFDSWPKLKAHAEALAAARTAAAKPELAPDSPATLHIRCGHDIQGALTRAGFVGAFHAFTDPYCQGPVIEVSLPEFLAKRAAFIGAAYGLYPDNVLQRLQAEYGALDDLGRYERVVLWFEHDSYDQLILAYLLTRLGGRGLPLELVCAERVPAVDRFAGLGQLAPEVIRVLWDGRRPVTPTQTALAGEVWRALTASSPEALAAIASADTPSIPPMAGALTRHLQELPSTANGLALTEQLTLDILAEAGPLTARQLFNRLSREREPLPFLGDEMFWPVLAGLAGGQRPLLRAPPDPADHHGGWPGRRISLTDHGALVRSGAADWLADAPEPRWVGGVEVRPRAPAWRWNGSAVQQL
ncbi:MAG TPA: DUF1835 domain-containing protein [Caulobacteraceae bacterium]|jgi:hypothetical protein